MAEHNKISSEICFIAIDIAKQLHDALIALHDGRKLVLRFPNTLAGYQRLLEAANCPASCIRIGFEPTADYHRNIAYWFAKQGCQCHLVPSLSVARAREMLFQTWDKHDRKDAKVILYLMQQGMSSACHDPLLSGYMDIQELSNTYYQLSLARTKCQHSLVNHYLTLYFPEMERFYITLVLNGFVGCCLNFPRH